MKQRIHIHNVLQSEVVVIGADEIPQIADKIDEIANYIDKTPAPVIRDIAYTSGLQAENALARAAIVATSPEDLREKLELLRRRIESGKITSFYTKGIYIGTEMCPAPGRTVFLFPGEGSQYPDMLRDISLHFPACRSAFDDADTASAMAGATIAPSQWIFPTGKASDRSIAEAMGMAAAVQSVLAANTGLLRIFTQLGILPDAVAGAGIGELVAMESAGAIAYKTREERLQALSLGHKLLSSIRSSNTLLTPCVCMSVSGLPQSKLTAILSAFSGNALVTRDMAFDLFTICVKQEVAADVTKCLTAAGGATHELPISKPFHTPWIRPVLPALASYFGQIITATPEIPVYSFMTASPYEGSHETWAEQVAEQWANPTRIRDTIERLYADGFRVFVELGARGALSTCVAATLRHRPHLALAVNRGHRSDILQLNHTLAALVAHGAPLNIRELHALRNSQEVDFAHPGPTHAQRQQHSVALNTKYSSLRNVPIPEGLIAPAPQLEKQVATAVPVDPKTDGRSGFPLLGDAEIIRFSPGENIDLLKTLSFLSHPFLIDRSLCPAGTSKTDRRLHGLTVAPVEVMLEVMAEAARKLYPNFAVTAVEDLRTIGWPTFTAGQCDMRVQAKRLPRSGSQASRERIAVEIFKSSSFSCETPEKLASAVIHVAQGYDAPPVPQTLALRSPVRLDWQGTDIYSERLSYGHSFQNMQEISTRGDNGLRAKTVVQPCSKLIRNLEAPVFTLDPTFLSAVGAALAAWHSVTPANGNLHFPYACDRIDFYSPTPHVWSKCDLNLFTDSAKDKAPFVSADAEIVDEQKRVLVKVSGWKNRVVALRPKLHHLILHPEDGFFTSETQRGAMPALPQEVICCIAPIAPTEATDDDFDIRMQITASVTLSVSEYIKWSELGSSHTRRIEWLFGRIAAKDAVRRCLLARYSRKWPPADIRIESDEQGKPRPQGEWRRLCGAPMDISITHSGEKIIAAAAPNASVGIDIEMRDRLLSEEFTNAAFSPLEQEIAAESGDGATTLLRFWCAKEALSKALGTGLRYGAGDLCARTFDPATGRIEMEASRLWLQPFPHLRGKMIDVQSCIIDNTILAVCVLSAADATAR